MLYHVKIHVEGRERTYGEAFPSPSIRQDFAAKNPEFRYWRGNILMDSGEGMAPGHYRYGEYDLVVQDPCAGVPYQGRPTDQNISGATPEPKHYGNPWPTRGRDRRSAW